MEGLTQTVERICAACGGVFLSDRTTIPADLSAELKASLEHFVAAAERRAVCLACLKRLQPKPRPQVKSKRESRPTDSQINYRKPYAD